MPLRTRWDVAADASEVPAKVIAPLIVATSPEMLLSRVDFPAPFAPTSATISPGATCQIRRGLRFAAELLFAAGAREVWPGIFGLPERLLPGEEGRLDSGPDDPRCYSWILSHLFGTARMAARASAGVVGHDFSVHGIPNLVVADSSVFPTNLGVNPQHAIMAVARLCAERLAERRN